MTYLSTNLAETQEHSPFPELWPRRYRHSTEELYSKAREAIEQLGWQVQSEDRNKLALGAVVTTPLWRFKDDVQIHIRPEPFGNTVYVRSKSRLGKGDLGANLRHVLDFYEILEQRLAGKNSSQ